MGDMSVAENVAGAARGLLRELVSVSSPSGDADAAEKLIAMILRELPQDGCVSRPESSSDGFAPDLLFELSGSGNGALLFSAHLDTVISHDDHQPLHGDGDKLYGTGTFDMKGGLALAIAALQELASDRVRFRRLGLLITCDEEWREVPLRHATELPLDEYDGCMCFEGGGLVKGQQALVTRRKGAATLHVHAEGRAAHSGTSPDSGRSALLTLSALAGKLDRLRGPGGRRLVPVRLYTGQAFNVVPARGELVLDVRAFEPDAIEHATELVPKRAGGVELQTRLVKRFDPMNTSAICRPLIAAAAERLGRPVAEDERGGASDASALSARIPVTFDGLGPFGDGDHGPDEYLLASSFLPQAELTLALSGAILDRPNA